MPEEYGGPGADFVTQGLVMAELASGDSAMSKAFSQNWKWSHLIASACTDDQKERFLKPFLADHRYVLNFATLLVAIGGVSWLTMARVIRGQVLSLKQQPFMEACRAIGVPLHRQFTRHLLPNLLGPIIVYATLTVPTAILSESFLSFLGIGIPPQTPTWGNIMAEGRALFRILPHNILFPGAFLAVTVLAVNMLGDGLRDSLDPRMRKRL